MNGLPIFQMDPWLIFLKALEIVAVLVAVFLITKFVSRVMQKLRETRNIERRFVRQINTFIKYLIYGIGFLVILSILGADITVIATGLGVVGIAVGFASKDIIANFLSGIFLIFEKAYQVNDVVRINDVYGIVRLMKLRSTQIKTFDGNIVTISNSKIAGSTIINHTSGADKMITSVSVKLGYNENLEEIKEIMKDKASEVEGVYLSRGTPIRFEVTDIGRRYHGVKLTMYFHAEAHREPWIKSEVYERINKALVDADTEFHKEAPR